MDKKEFALFAAALKTYYPKESLLPNSQAMELWFRQLQDIPYSVAELALNKWVAPSKWSPTIADLREAAACVVNGEKPDWSEGWDMAVRMIKKYGSYNQAAAMNEMDKMTAETVKRLGYQELCRSTNIMADRANFRMIFEQLAERDQKQKQLSVTLQQLIEGVQRKELPNESKRLSASNPQD